LRWGLQWKSFFEAFFASKKIAMKSPTEGNAQILNYKMLFIAELSGKKSNILNSSSRITN
jgi:hypothetical protein